jgi:hypothetical protein
MRGCFEFDRRILIRTQSASCCVFDLESSKPSELPSLRHPIVPIGNGLGRLLVHADAFDLRKGNSHRAIAPFGLDHHFSEAVSFVVV